MDIARGMEYIHSQRAIHCDLKLHNLVLNQQHRVKIADFGHSVLIDTMDQRIEDHRKIVFGGSMAPELCTEFDDDETVIFHEFDRKIDVFSFGVILWQIYERADAFNQRCSITIAFGSCLSVGGALVLGGSIAFTVNGGNLKVSSEWGIAAGVFVSCITTAIGLVNTSMKKMPRGSFSYDMMQDGSVNV